jgi:hypothetical protein
MTGAVTGVVRTSFFLGQKTPAADLGLALNIRILSNSPHEIHSSE